MRLLFGLLLLILPCQGALAGAWTQAEDHWQIIGGLIFSNADRGYDSHGYGRAPVTFERALFQTSTDYGWSDRLTLFARTETAYAHFRDSFTAPVTALDNALEGGARLRLMNDEDDGILSVEGSLRTAGAFNFAVSASSLASGRSAGFRVLYGRNIVIAGMTGFLDVEAGETYLSRPRPNETPIDLTAGLWIDADTMAMAQSFNLIGAGGGSRQAYPFFRSHKIELSLVRKITERYSVQLGAFFSPAGQNALVEQGACLALWTNI